MKEVLAKIKESAVSPETNKAVIEALYSICCEQHEMLDKFASRIECLKQSENEMNSIVYKLLTEVNELNAQPDSVANPTLLN